MRSIGLLPPVLLPVFLILGLPVQGLGIGHQVIREAILGHTGVTVGVPYFDFPQRVISHRAIRKKRQIFPGVLPFVFLVQLHGIGITRQRRAIAPQLHRHRQLIPRGGPTAAGRHTDEHSGYI